MKKSLILFAFFLFTAQFCNGQAEWHQYQGPYCGNITAFTSKGDTLYSADNGGSIYVSYDQGYHWSFLINPQQFMGEISALCYYDSKLFAGWSSSTKMSADGGISWSSCPELSGTNVFFVFRDSLYAGTSNGIFLYNPGYNTWSDKSNGFSTVEPTNLNRNVRCITSLDSTLFCGTIVDGLYVSNDRGENWEKALLPNSIGETYIMKITAFHDTIFATTNNYDRNLYISSDTGKTWTNMAFARDDNSFYDMKVYNDQLLVSTNKGIYKYESSTPAWSLFNEDPFDELFVKDTLFLASYPLGLFRWSSTDTNFIFSNQGINSAIVYDVAIFNNTLYCATSSGCYYTSDEGTTWNIIPETKNKYCGTFMTNDTMFYIGTGDGILATSTNANNWWHIDNGLTSKVIWEIAAIDTMMLTTTDDGLFKSADYGQNWALVNGHPSQLQQIAYGDDMVLIGNNYGLYKLSSDWMTVEPIAFQNQPVNSIAFIDHEIYVSVENEGLYKSIDSCATWIQVTPLLIDGIIKRGDNLYASGFAVIYYSSDNGVTWDQMSETGVPYTAISCIYQGDSCFYAGTFGSSVFKRNYLDSTECTSTLYSVINTSIGNITPNTNVNEFESNLSLSHGASSVMYRNGLPLPDQSIVANGDTLKIIAEDGVSQKVYTIGTSPVSIESKETNQISIYPNPSAAKVIIENMQSTDFKVEIFNLQGAKVYEKSMTSNVLDISNLTSGIYTLKIIDAKGVMTTKLIKK